VNTGVADQFHFAISDLIVDANSSTHVIPGGIISHGDRVDVVIHGVRGKPKNAENHGGVAAVLKGPCEATLQEKALRDTTG